MKKHLSTTVLPPAVNPFNERPTTMSIEDYKAQRKLANKSIRSRLQRGILCFLSNEILFDELGHPVGMKWKKGKTFEGSVKFLQMV
jgi:hypothetical protein